MQKLSQSFVPYSARGGRKQAISLSSSHLALTNFFEKIAKSSGDKAPIIIRQIVKKLKTSNRNRPVMKITDVIESLEDKSKVAMVVAKVLDDERVLSIPKVTVVALKWSKSVQKKIEANGGNIYTLDQFMKAAGSLENINLVKGDPNRRKASKYFGPAPGERGSATYPRQTKKGKNAEKRIMKNKQAKFEFSDEE